MMPPRSVRSVFATTLRSCRGALVAIGLISGVVNLLYLTGSFFMLQVYDRVLPSRSVPTLVALGILAAALYAFQGVLDLIRARILVRIGAMLEVELGGRVFGTIMRLPLAARGGGEGLQPLRDLDQVRSFLVGAGPSAFFDLPWIPLYLGICFLFHPLIGWWVLAGAGVLIALTLATEGLTRAPVKSAAAAGAQRNALAEAGRRNAEVVAAMGMGPGLLRLWEEASGRSMEGQQRASDVGGGFGAISKVLRMLLQSFVLGFGAYLVIQQEATAGVIIASSILTARALAPVEIVIANWKGFVAARQSARRLADVLKLLPDTQAALALPPPRTSLSVENVSVVPPGASRPVVQDVSLVLESRQGLGIVGPSASGKSSLARALVGVWTPARGKVRLDGAALEQWRTDELGRHVGYLPQDVELFAGTVAQNISRFAAEPEDAQVIAAARAAGVHDLVLRLPDGYDTQVGEGGAALSAGQRQRLALARALYGEPFLVVLDEPNSNLDQEGEHALTQAIVGVRNRGGIVVVIAHRPSALAGVDRLLVMASGRPQALGPKDEVLRRLARPAPPPSPLKIVAGTEEQAGS